MAPGMLHKIVVLHMISCVIALPGYIEDRTSRGVGNDWASNDLPGACQTVDGPTAVLHQPQIFSNWPSSLLCKAHRGCAMAADAQGIIWRGLVSQLLQQA